MPLTAEHGGDVVDATACSDAAWAAIYKTRPRALLLCRACAHAMHAKLSPRATRFFAHDRTVADCPATGETPLHRLLKTLLAEGVRAEGWSAVVEATPGERDAGGWRADVLAVDTSSSRRVAFEVQLAAQTTADAQARTARYRIDDIDVIWLTTRNAPWLWAVPGCRVLEVTTTDHAGGRPGFTVTQGLAKLVDDTWTVPPPVPLARVVTGVLTATIVAWALKRVCDAVAPGTKERPPWRHEVVGLVPARQLERGRELDAQRAREEARADAEAERRSADALRRHAYIEALYERQEHLAPVAAADAAGAGNVVWAGVPATLAPPGSALGRVTAAGNEATARAAVIWVGPEWQSLRLFAVCSPVASLITPRLAASWRRRGVRVYVADPTEAARVARALNWPASDLHLVERRARRPPG